MRTLQEAYTAVETYSPADERFNRRRRTTGLFLGPALLAAVLAAPLPLAAQAHHLAGIMALMGVLWVTEALPMPVTALLGPLLAVVLQVAPAQQALAAFADPIIFLFIGSFILAEAMFVHGLNRRIAFTALAWRSVGSSAPRTLLVYGAVVTALSMWISNTATTAMMFPIGLSIIDGLARARKRGSGAAVRRFAMAMMLVTSFGASIGGMGTPVGTPPNLIGVGFLEHFAGIHVTFFQWMAIGVPLVVLLFAYLTFYSIRSSARGLAIGQESRDLVVEELRKLGPMTRGERNVLVAFGTTVVLWTLPGVLAATGAGGAAVARGLAASVPEGVAALIGAVLLFMLPVSWRARRFTITWEEAVRIDWGIILLYGGGLAIGQLAFSTGLASAVGEGLAWWMPDRTPFALIVMFTGLSIVLSEATSNTAAANMIVPVAIAVCQAAGVSPILPALGATLGSSMGFMMPISTASNAIVYSSGYIPIGQMVKSGFLLDLVAFVLIVGILALLGPLVF